MLATVALACRDHQRLRLAYTDRAGTASERTVEPHGLVQQDRLWYLVAWDVERSGWRSFRADRISGGPSSAGRFHPRTPPPGGAAAFVADRARARPVWEARVVVHCAAAALVARLPPGYGTVEPIDDQTALLQVRTAWLDGLAVTLAALESDLDVLAPPELGDELRRWARRFAGAARGSFVPA